MALDDEEGEDHMDIEACQHTAIDEAFYLGFELGLEGEADEPDHGLDLLDGRSIGEREAFRQGLDDGRDARADQLADLLYLETVGY